MEVYSTNNTAKESGWTVSIQPSVSQGRQVKQVDLRKHRTTMRPQPEIEQEPLTVDFPRLQEIAREVGEKLKSAGVNIQFEVNKELQQIVIKVLDPVSGEVVREIPPEALRRAAQVLRHQLNTWDVQGIEIDELF